MTLLEATVVAVGFVAVDIVVFVVVVGINVGVVALLVVSDQITNSCGQ